MVGGILAYVGIPGFLPNLNLLYDQADPSRQQWQSSRSMVVPKHSFGLCPGRQAVGGVYPKTQGTR